MAPLVASEPSTRTPTWSTRVASAVPDLAFASVYLLTWWDPYTFGDRMVAYLMLVMLMEFIIVHSSAFMTATAYSESMSRKKRVSLLLGFGLFYLLFALGFGAGFGAWWPVWTMIALILNRILTVLLGKAPNKDQRLRIHAEQAASALFYIFGVMLTTFLPFPRLGLTPAVVARQNLPGSGVWIDEPHRVIAFGFLYFAAMALFELVGHGWEWFRRGLPER